MRVKFENWEIAIGFIIDINLYKCGFIWLHVFVFTFTREGDEKSY